MQGFPRFQKRNRSRSRSRSRSRNPFAAPAGVQLFSSFDNDAIALPWAQEQPVNIDSLANPLVKAAVELKFVCQLAHGSPSAVINKWTNVDELHQSIADAFGLTKADIIFLTVNSFKIDMENLFTGSLNFTDMVYAHVRGQHVELTVTKAESSFGVTITDNGLGNAFIKAIKPGSVFDKSSPAASVGQLIEKINGESMLGKRHFEVARVLRNLPIGSAVTLFLVCPLQSAGVVTAKGKKEKKKINYAEMTGTIRFKSNGLVTVNSVQEEAPEKEIIAKLNSVFDSYLGVQDDQLAMRVWEEASKCTGLSELSDAIAKTELSIFEFPEELVFDMWGIIGDWKRCQQKQQETQDVPRMENADQRVFF